MWDHLCWGAPVKAQETTACLLLHPGARACAPPENNIPRKQQEPPGEVTELACGTDQVSCPSSPPQSCQLCHLSPELPSVFSALSCVLWHCPLPQLRSFPVCPLLHPCPSRQLHLFLPGPHLPRHLQLRLLFPSPPSSLGPPVLSSSAVFSLITLCNLFPDIHPWPLSSSGPPLCPHQMQFWLCISLPFNPSSPLAVAITPSLCLDHPHYHQPPYHLCFIAVFPLPHQPGPIHCP